MLHAALLIIVIQVIEVIFILPQQQLIEDKIVDAFIAKNIRLYLNRNRVFYNGSYLCITNVPIQTKTCENYRFLLRPAG